MNSSPASSVQKDDLWHAYELALKHYETDLQLFSTRMNFFFGVNSAVFTVAVSVAIVVNGEVSSLRSAVKTDCVLDVFML